MEHIGKRIGHTDNKGSREPVDVSVPVLESDRLVTDVYPIEVNKCELNLIVEHIGRRTLAGAVFHPS
jgi:hypothetical protein